MIRKPLNLPPAVAKAFIKDMRAFHAEPNRYKQDEIALQLHALKEHQGPRERPPRFRRERDVPADEGRSLNRIGRRTIICMFLIVALAVIWNVVGR
jgi:hypothetical protein